MKAFHNNPEIKEKYLNRVKAHAEANEIVKGYYWENGKGCAVGCTIHDSSHLAYERELGISSVLANLEDTIFERLPNELAMTWPIRFLEAIPIGADLSKVWPKFAIFLLTDSSQCASRHPQCDIVADAYRKELEGEEVDWESISNTANAACTIADAAYAAANAANAAYAAVTASCASNCAVYSAAAAYTTANAAITKQSEKLLELLRECK